MDGAGDGASCPVPVEAPAEAAEPLAGEEGDRGRGATWPELRRQLDRIAVGTFAGPAGTFRQRTQITDAQAAILTRLGIDPPPRIYHLTPAVSR